MKLNKKHLTDQHGNLKTMNRKYNCGDCNFETSKSIDLKKHAQVHFISLVNILRFVILVIKNLEVIFF